VNGSKRGVLLSIYAVLFAILALSDLLKPFRLEGPTTGFVFLGMRTAGAANAVLGPLFGIILLAYAAGIWWMKGWVLPLSYAYTAWVIANLVLFTIRNPFPTAAGEQIFGIVYTIVAIAISVSSALMLRARSANLD